MGTRADFYVGRGDAAEWLGSIAWDGYPSGIPGKATGTSEGDVSREPIFVATTEAAYREAVDKHLASRDDATRPAQGWPWPWDDSRTTDYAYAFDGGQVLASCFGHAWFDPKMEQPEGGDEKVAVFPNMKDRKNVRWDNGSGVILLGG